MDDEAKIAAVDPVALFNDWFAEAKAGEPVNPDAAALATAGRDGRASVRMVLVKSADARGFVFYTNSESRKGLEMAANPRASIVFYWKSLLREVRVEGPVAMIDPAESDAYHQGRPRASQIGAWASIQSRPMSGRFEFERRIAQFTAKFALGAVPRPPFWNGYRIAPESIEFWQERKFRLHDRILYTRVSGGWSATRLYP